MIQQLKEYGTLNEVLMFLKSDYYIIGEEGDNCINAFKEYLADQTDVDLEQQYKIDHSEI